MYEKKLKNIGRDICKIFTEKKKQQITKKNKRSFIVKKKYIYTLY